MQITQSNKFNFKGQNLYVGIDVHKKSWSVTILSENSVLKKFSQAPDPQLLHNFLTRNYPEGNYYSVYEAGFCGFWIHEELTKLGISNIVVTPGDVPSIIKEKLHKTDTVDSNRLARALRSGELNGIYVPTREELENRSLLRARYALVRDLTREKNRIKGFLHFYGIEFPEQFSRPNTHWSQRFMAWLKSLEFATQSAKITLNFHILKAEHIRALLLQETRAIRILSRTEKYKKQMEFLTSVPGVGEFVGMTLLTEICDIKRFHNSDQLASFIGLIPMCHSSGEHEHIGDMTVRKHSILRCYIVESAWKAVRNDPAMTLAYETNLKKMHPCKAIVKIARKLVNRIFFVLKHEQRYVSCVVK